LRIACRECPRIGRYRLAVLAERFGADADTQDVLEALFCFLRWPALISGAGCGAAPSCRTSRRHGRRTCRGRCCRASGYD